VTGFSRYKLDLSASEPSITLHQRDGIASTFPSRVAADPRLRGTKRLVVERRRVLLTRGLRDSRLVLIVPEIRDGVPTGVSLLHVVLRDRLTSDAVRRVLVGYDPDRWRQLVAALTETDQQMDEGWLATVGVEATLVGPVERLAPGPQPTPEEAR
jgi:glutamine---fructose-6-phosphate transaminase (isomerizing)